MIYTFTLEEQQEVISRSEAQARTIEKLQAEIKRLRAGLYVCDSCGHPTARPYTMGKGIVTCKDCRLKKAKAIKKAK